MGISLNLNTLLVYKIFEKKLDAVNVLCKRLEIQEALGKPAYVSTNIKNIIKSIYISVIRNLTLRDDDNPFRGIGHYGYFYRTLRLISPYQRLKMMMKRKKKSENEGDVSRD